MNPDTVVTDADDHVHYAWDNDPDPVATVEDGEVCLTGIEVVRNGEAVP